MAVQNFLEDEEYADDENGESRSFVPNFLDEEDYDEPGDEYYGGGFSDSVQPVSSASNNRFSPTNSLDEHDDSEAEDLFDGSFDFMSDDEVDFEGDATNSSGASYSISGLNQKTSVAISKPVVSDSGSVSTKSEGSTGSQSVEPNSDANIGSTESTSTSKTQSAAASHHKAEVNTSDTAKTKRRRDLSSKPSGSRATAAKEAVSSKQPISGSFVPNFLDEEEYDSSVTPDKVTDLKSSTSLHSSDTSESSLNKKRRDLSRRPSSNSSRPIEGESNSSRAGQNYNSSPIRKEGGLDSSGKTDSTVVEGLSGVDSKQPRDVISATKKSPSLSKSPVVSAPLSFDSKPFVGSMSDSEAARLKTPSVSGVPLKFTALKQADAVVRRVGADGLTNTERVRMEKAKLKASVRLPGNGKLSEEELLFYANLGATKSSDVAAKRKLILPPVLGESVVERREREALINRSLPGGSIARGAKTRLTEKDYMVLQFIALFKFVSERQVGKLLQVGEHSAYKRLNSLRKHGLTKGFKTLGVKGSVWVLTDTGMDLSGFELPRGTEASLTLSMVSHQFTVNHVAAHLWSGGANVLRENNFPQSNRLDFNGKSILGESVVSELQIQSAFGKIRGSSKAEAFVPQIKKEMASQFDRWKRSGGVDFGPSPELLRGNEYMWTLFPPISTRLSYHVPDLVVARPRSADGSPQSIAVEVELKTKADDSSYERTLDAYRMDDSIYKKVVWVCRLRGTAEKLMRIAKKNGLMAQKRFAIVPIYLESGKMFTGKDTWSL